MDIAVIGTSKKENEKRVPIHPQHIGRLPESVRRHLYFEQNYGLSFGMKDEEIQVLTGNCPTERRKLLGSGKTVLITKPVVSDLEQTREGSAVWGWVHSVQQWEITQIAIDRKLTLIAWENMFYRGKRDTVHTFYKNNEIAGYAGVLHALQAMGIDGNYGPARTAAIISFGSVSRGAVYALRAHGINDITVYTRRPASLIAHKMPGTLYKQFAKNASGRYDITNPDGSKKPLLDELTAADIIVNGILQDPANPVVFVADNDVAKFKKPCLAIDVSCSRAMGFSFASSTTFSNPVFRVGNITYYGVDHTPTLLWDSATWEISKALLPYVHHIVEETDCDVLDDAVDIRKGKILNKEILVYQNRARAYPYSRLI